QGKKQEAVNVLFDLVKTASEAKDLDGKAVPLSPTATTAKEKLTQLDPEKAKELPQQPVDLDPGSLFQGLPQLDSIGRPVIWGGRRFRTISVIICISYTIVPASHEFTVKQPWIGTDLAKGAPANLSRRASAHIVLGRVSALS